MTKHIHLDLVGGLSGDMFISALLDVFPDAANDLDSIIEAAGFPDLVELAHEPFNDGTLTGTRFHVVPSDPGQHQHRHYSEIIRVIGESDLAIAVKQAALEIFRLIAEVEAKIHGKSVAEVAFHEVGAWDSIADIILAAHLATSHDIVSWSVSKIPLGSGFIKTAHGRLPVPAPATARLLEGFEVHDDGIAGERVTPTGAAILKFLAPAARVPDGCRLAATGYGFGSKVFPGISNVVRATSYTREQASHFWQEDRVSQLSFELDDQTPESIAYATTRLIESSDVLDVMQQPIFGKKGRQGCSITVLVKQGAEDAVIATCFTYTTTLGIRRDSVSRAILPRREIVVPFEGHQYRVKVAKRPTGLSAKVEMDDLIAAKLSVINQDRIRHEVERIAIQTSMDPD